MPRKIRHEWPREAVHEKQGPANPHRIFAERAANEIASRAPMLPRGQQAWRVKIAYRSKRWTAAERGNKRWIDAERVLANEIASWDKHELPQKRQQA